MKKKPSGEDIRFARRFCRFSVSPLPMLILSLHNTDDFGSSRELILLLNFVVEIVSRRLNSDE